MNLERLRKRVRQYIDQVGRGAAAVGAAALGGRREAAAEPWGAPGSPTAVTLRGAAGMITVFQVLHVLSLPQGICAVCSRAWEAHRPSSQLGEG